MAERNAGVAPILRGHLGQQIEDVDVDVDVDQQFEDVDVDVDVD
ncbi:hypothetical protein ACPSZA_09110 [Yersinia pestis]